MINDGIVYHSLVEALSVLGKRNVELVLKILRSEGVIQGEKVDQKRLELALRSIFGDGTKVLLAPYIKPLRQL